MCVNVGAWFGIVRKDYRGPLGGSLMAVPMAFITIPVSSDEPAA